MVELTDAVETIVSIMKNASTGIGTTGYEITDDDSSGLTISGGQLLVSYTMSKEELKEAFGGSQDFDVVFTVQSKEDKDEYIGFHTKEWIQKVKITIHVIDKWSAVGSGNKYITGHLVRYKAVNALRKFIKAKALAPGGTIHIWKLREVRNIEDTSTKPTMYKAEVMTEAWTYYNPSKVIDLTLESKRDTDQGNNLGTITFDGDAYSSLPDTVVNETKSSVTITYTVAGTDTFINWTVEGQLVLASATSISTTLTINGRGTLTANYTGCPSGEQITNGTFETGDGTGWVTSGGAIDSGNYRNGSYGWQLSTQNGYIEQLFTTFVAVACITTFELYWKGVGCPLGDGKITITYSDDTTTVITDTGIGGTWEQVDILAQLTAGKIVKKIKIEMTNAGYLAIDDVSLT